MPETEGTVERQYPLPDVLRRDNRSGSSADKLQTAGWHNAGACWEAEDTVVAGHPGGTAEAIYAELVDVTNKTFNHSFNIAIAEDKSQLALSSPFSETKARKTAPKYSSVIQLKGLKGNLIGFLRVIKALHKEGLFETLGGRPKEDEVYAAFGIAVNEGLDDFSAQLSANRKDNTLETRCELFDLLKKIYKEYEQYIDNKKKEKQ